MMMMHPKAPTKNEALAETWVWWDINRCPVPDDVDARRVGPSIKGALKNLGYTGRLTITAIGILTETPFHVLQKLCSTGISLKHVLTDINAIAVELILWSWNNPPPANIMLISSYSYFNVTLANLKYVGYNILRSIFKVDNDAKQLFLWNTLLARLRAGALQEEEEKCSETGEPALICSTCRVDEADMRFPGFDSFITHLNSREQYALETADATAIQKKLQCYREGCRREAEEKYKKKVQEEEDEEDEEEEE